MNVKILACFKDNYSYVIYRDTDSQCLVVDACEFSPLENYFQTTLQKPTAILTTHHHWDHVGGNIESASRWKCAVYGAAADAARIPGLTHAVEPNQTLSLADFDIQTFLIPGHTSHHLAYYFATDKILFVGDTVFSCGCGRLFEGSFQDMLQTLNNIKKLPPETRIYGGHEYSKKNTEFALTLEPQNLALQKRYQQVLELLQHNQPTLPTTLEMELQINPFLRCFSPEIKKSLSLSPDASELETFTALRTRRDTY